MAHSVYQLHHRLLTDHSDDALKACQTTPLACWAM